MKKIYHFSLFILMALVSLVVAYLLVDWPSSADVAPFALTDSRPAPQVQPAQLSPAAEFTVCTAANNQWNPAIYSHVVVWQDWRNDPGDWTNTDIYGYDLNAKQEFTVCTAANWQQLPAIYGNLVVWEDLRNDPGNWSNADIYGYDLDTGQEFTVCTAANHQERPAIYGHVVVWQDTRSGGFAPWDIYGYDLSTGQEFTICTATDLQQLPAIHGHVVVWMDNRSNPGSWVPSYDIYGCNLDTGQEFTICTEGHNQQFPAVYGNVVVWQDDRNTSLDIYGYDLSTKQEFTICAEAHNQYFPALYGHVVVWQDRRNGNDVYGYDLSTGRAFAVYTAESGQQSPAIYSSVVVWEDDRNGDVNWDIYGTWLRPDLSSSHKAVNVTTTTPGRVLTYTIVLSNSGSLPGSCIYLTDTVPVGTVYVPGSLWAGSGIAEAAGNEIRWRGVISAGVAVTVSYRVTVIHTLSAGWQITNAAHVDDGYASFWTNGVTTTIGNVEVNLPLIMKNQTIRPTVQ